MQLIILLILATTLAQDIIFDDGPSPSSPSETAQSQSNSEIANRRPQFGLNFNNLVRNPIGAIASFVNTILTTPPPVNQETESYVDEPVPDCRTFRYTDGYCMPLESCESLRNLLYNRPQISINRILRRSICGFTGFNSLVCCAEPNGNIFIDNKPITGENFQVRPIFERPTFGQESNRPKPQPSPTPLTPNRPIPSSNPQRPFRPRPQPTREPSQPITGQEYIGNKPPRPVPVPPGVEFEKEPITNLPLGNIDIRSSCGFSNASHTRIVGGKEAPKGAWPWIAALGYRSSNGNIIYLCGGTLISHRHVLTAAHCVSKQDLVTVRLGEHNLFSSADGANPKEFGVDKIIISPKYNTKTFQNDIAIVILDKRVDYTMEIHPICIPNSRSLRNERFENKTPFVAGWGAIEFNGPTTAVLREVQLPIVSDEICQEKYRPFKNTKVDDTNICAGFQRGGQDTCQGDSGGPLMQPIESTIYVQIGIVSFGFKCAEPNFPGVYTRVTSHIDWIEETLATNP